MAKKMLEQLFLENLKRYEPKVCFLCGEKCEVYCHYSCAMAFSEDKKKRIDDAWRKAEEIAK